MLWLLLLLIAMRCVLEGTGPSSSKNLKEYFLCVCVCVCVCGITAIKSVCGFRLLPQPHSSLASSLDGFFMHATESLS